MQNWTANESSFSQIGQPMRASDELPRDSEQSSADRDQRERGHRQHCEAAEAKKQFFYAGT